MPKNRNVLIQTALIILVSLHAAARAQAQTPPQTRAPKRRPAAASSPSPANPAAAATQTPAPAAPAAAAPAAAKEDPLEFDNNKTTPLNTNVKPTNSDSTIPSVYKDMVVVQRKAKKKADHFLFAPSGTIDFSDGPITSYAINTNVGYAISDFWEVYANLVPAFITNERPIVGKVRALQLANGDHADIAYNKPQFQYGIEALYLPAYGKESWGPHSIVRSDTFFKFGLAQISFSGGQSGTRVNAMVGKTYFISNLVNIRAAAGLAYGQSIVDTQKVFNWEPVIEAGLVYYF